MVMLYIYTSYRSTATEWRTEHPNWSWRPMGKSWIHGALVLNGSRAAPTQPRWFCLPLPHHEDADDAQPGQPTPADQRDSPYHVALCSATQAGRKERGSRGCSEWCHLSFQETIVSSAHSLILLEYVRAAHSFLFKKETTNFRQKNLTSFNSLK